MSWESIIVKLLAGLVILIPLVSQLVKYVTIAVQEKNWAKVVGLVMSLMAEAEQKFQTGADKKQWVLAMLKASADTINFQMNMDQISELIDALCEMSKQVNAQ